jgi:hypothetical protein
MVKWYWLVLVGVGAIVLTVLAFKFWLEKCIDLIFWILSGKDKKKK